MKKLKYLIHKAKIKEIRGIYCNSRTVCVLKYVAGVVNSITAGAPNSGTTEPVTFVLGSNANSFAVAFTVNATISPLLITGVSLLHELSAS
jgi:hypothetical protein